MSEERKTTVETPLEPATLIFTQFIGHDEISRCFAFTVGFISSDANVDALKLLGKPISVEGDAGDPKRWFSGLVSDFRLTRVEEGFAYYERELRRGSIRYRGRRDQNSRGGTDEHHRRVAVDERWHQPEP